MKHYYYLIQAGAQIDTTSKFYLVGIGTSKQANRDFLFLTAAAVDNNWFFEIRSQQSSDFISKVAESIYPHADVSPLMYLKFVHCDARDLVRALKSSTQVAHQPYSINAQHDALTKLSLNYRLNYNLKNR